MAWFELSIAMMTGAADSGSAGTVLFGFNCAMRMVSCGVAQELVVVGVLLSGGVVSSACEAVVPGGALVVLVSRVAPCDSDVI